jgi:hypothetical protein
MRSPNYPAIGLSSAIDRARLIHKTEGKNAVAREALAKVLGYGGLNGGSSVTLSALNKYGLIEAVGDGEARITDLAMRIMYPDNEDEKRAAIEAAAFKPTVFSEIREKWPDRPPGDDSLRSFLVRKGFSEGALDQVIQFYREIIDMVPASEPVQDSPSANKSGNPVTEQPSIPNRVAPPANPHVGQTHVLSVLPPGKPFGVSFDGTTLTGSMSIRSVRDIDRLIKVLHAQKAAFEAMQDGQDDGAEEPID